MEQCSFERKESKYIATPNQCRALLESFDGVLEQREFSSYSVINAYFDTQSFDLARASIEKPEYKEKLRLRSYGTPTDESPVYLELKKKFKGVVYKRRAALPYWAAKGVLEGKGIPDGFEGQIFSEIRYFMSLRPLAPTALIQYEREAYCGREGLRLTIDRAVRFRTNSFAFNSKAPGRPLLDEALSLIEIKAQNAMPIELARAVSECGLQISSFSKYSECYKRYLAPDLLLKSEAGYALGA